MSATGKRRVVVTGIGALSPLGNDWASVRAHLRSGRNAIRVMDEWKDYEGLNTQLGSTVPPFELPSHYNRKTMRSMGRVARDRTSNTRSAAAKKSGPSSRRIAMRSSPSWRGAATASR